MEDTHSLDFESRVKRNSKPCYVRDLKLSDEFEHGGKYYRLTTKRATLGECVNGVRVLLSNGWHVVMLHGRLNLLFPLEDLNNPFSAMQETVHAGFDQDIELKILTFKELEAA